MATKTINLTEDAYARLHSLKREGESFSDVVNRLTGKHAILGIVGVLDGPQARRLRAAKREMGRRARASAARRAKRMR